MPPRGDLWNQWLTGKVSEVLLMLKDLRVSYRFEGFYRTDDTPSPGDHESKGLISQTNKTKQLAASESCECGVSAGYSRRSGNGKLVERGAD